MEKRKKCVKVGFSTILWAVLAIVLCAAPSGWAVTFDDGLEHDIDYEILGDYVEVKNATLNLLPGAYIEWYLIANAGSTVNIKGGKVDWLVCVNPGSNVTVYGKSFTFQGQPHFAGEELFISKYHPDYSGPLTVVYEDNTQVDLPIDCYYETEGGTIVNYATITLAAPGSTTIDIDIKPGGNPNNINLKSKGVVPVAVLTTKDFDASDVDPESVTFAGAKPVRCKLCDVDGDGDDDLLFHFKTQELVELDENSEEATLTCETSGGDTLTGTDTVRIIQPKK